MTVRYESFPSIKTLTISATRIAWTTLALLGIAPIHLAHAQVQPQTFGTTADDFAQGLAVSGSAVYVAGVTSGSLDGNNLGGQDVFLRKYDEDGKVLWARQFGTSADDVSTGAAADGSGSVYVSGFTSGSLGGHSGGVDAFLRKYTAQGQVAWTRQIGTSAQDVANGVSIDGSGDVYIAGFTYGSLQGTNQGGSDVFVYKYHPNGWVIWRRQFGTSTTDHGQGIAVDAHGNAYVAGYTKGALAGTNKGADDGFIRKYNAAGDVLWTRQFGTSGDDLGFAVATDSTGAAVVTGYTTGSFAGFTNAGGKDVFVVKYSGSGELVYTDQFGTSGDDVPNPIATDPAGNFYVTGYTNGTLGRRNAGGFDVFVRKYTSNNRVEWTRQFGTRAGDAAYSIAAATAGKIYVAGQTWGSLGSRNHGDSDAFVRRLNEDGRAVWTDHEALNEPAPRAQR